MGALPRDTIRTRSGIVCTFGQSFLREKVKFLSRILICTFTFDLEIGIERVVVVTKLPIAPPCKSELGYCCSRCIDMRKHFLYDRSPYGRICGELREKTLDVR